MLVVYNLVFFVEFTTDTFDGKFLQSIMHWQPRFLHGIVLRPLRAVLSIYMYVNDGYVYICCIMCRGGSL